MVEISVTYSGNKKCDLVHPEGARLRTDAPKDIGGEASAFSPTDLIAAGLASCILTTIAMWAERNGLKIDGATASVEKHMSAQPPRRIARLVLRIEMPAGIPEETRAKLRRAAAACPVHHSLHPEIASEVEWAWG